MSRNFDIAHYTTNSSGVATLRSQGGPGQSGHVPTRGYATGQQLLLVKFYTKPESTQRVQSSTSFSVVYVVNVSSVKLPVVRHFNRCLDKLGLSDKFSRKLIF